MLLRHIIAATDESDAGRQAVRTAIHLASQSSARVSVLRVVPVKAAPRFAGVAEGTGLVGPADEDPELGRMRRWLGAGVLAETDLERVELGVAFGIPGIEICRYADRSDADLVIMGRKPHSPMMRLLLGDTADAVARRNRIPSLFVQQGCGYPRTILVALDGSDRGMAVLREAADLASQTGATLHAITVERGPIDEPPQLASSLPLTRSTTLQERLTQVFRSRGLPDIPLAIRRGDPFEQIIKAVQEIEADVLALGYHRGGPPGVLEAGSTARRLAHVVPGAVLTIPL